MMKINQPFFGLTPPKSIGLSEKTKPLRFGNDDDKHRRAMQAKLQAQLPALTDNQLDTSDIFATPDGRAQFNAIQPPALRHYKGEFEKTGDSSLPSLPGTSPGNHAKAPWRAGLSISSIIDQLLQNLGLPLMQRQTQPFLTEARRMAPERPRPRGVGLNHRATMRAAFVRSMQVGSNFEVNPETDLRYRRIEVAPKIHRRAKASIIYAMDYSGSMEKRIQRVKDTMWFFSNYIKYKHGMMLAQEEGMPYTDEAYFGRGVQEYFLLQDTVVKETDYDGFVKTTANGGTTLNVVENAVAYMTGVEGYDPKQNYTGVTSQINLRDTNVYVVHFTDCETDEDDLKQVTKKAETLLGQGINRVSVVHVTEGKEAQPLLKGFGDSRPGFNYCRLPDASVISIKAILKSLLAPDPKREQELAEILEQ